MARKTNAELAAEVADLQARLTSTGAAHRNDIALISERFNDEANSRSWCAEYQEVIADLNTGLNVPLQVTPNQYEAITDVEVTVRLPLSVSVEATHADAVNEALVQASIDNGTHGFGSLMDAVANVLRDGEGRDMTATVVAVDRIETS